MNNKTFGIIALLFCTFCITLIVCESFVRWLDGYQLFSLALKDNNAHESRKLKKTFKPDYSIEPVAIDFLNSSKDIKGVDKQWFFREPQALPNRRKSADSDLVKRQKKVPLLYKLESSYVWNYYFLQDQICTRFKRKKQKNIVKNYFPSDDINLFVFKPEYKSTHPVYRFLPNRNYPGGLVSNEFGFRGRPLKSIKASNTIRLAFLGSSTTFNQSGLPFSYPEYIEEWLNIWAKNQNLPVNFEIINSARSGNSSADIAEIAVQEVLPLHPDYMFYYEGSNQFWPNKFIHFKRPKILRRKPSRTFELKPIENYSAIAHRIYKTQRSNIVKSGKEPVKPSAKIEWPVDLNAHDPDLNYPKLPLKLKQILSDFDRIRIAAQHSDSGAKFVPMTFVWLPYEGMLLDLPKQTTIYQYCNRSMWPFSYAWIRHNADFQNEAFKKYARIHQLDLIDVDASMPKKPELFVDAIHNNYTGIRLRAWIVFQEIVQLLDKDQPWLKPRNIMVNSPTIDFDDVITLKKSDVKNMCRHVKTRAKSGNIS